MVETRAVQRTNRDIAGCVVVETAHSHTRIQTRTDTQILIHAHRHTHTHARTQHDPSQINEIFDTISYAKGSAVIRMLETHLGRAVFDRGITLYLTRHQVCVCVCVCVRV